MAVDYDLVILGSSAIAELLALEAKSRSARIAWITFPQIISDWQIQQLLSPNPDWQWRLAVSGIDVLTESAQFIAPNVVQAGERRFSARHFVVCHPIQPSWRQVSGGWTWQDFYELRHNLTELTIAGGDALCLAIAQWLNKQGVPVSLLVPTATIFPQIDREAARFWQAQLESQGIKILTGHRVTATQLADDGQSVVVWAGDRRFAVKHLLLPHFISVVPQLNLDLVSHKRLHYLTHSTDIDCILQKVIFSNWFGRTANSQATKQTITYCYTQPAIAQVVSSKDIRGTKLVLRSANAGHFAKLIATPSGQILSATMVGESAVFWIEAIAQAMQNQQSIKTFLANDSISQELVAQFYRQQSQPLLELWLNICRDFNLA